MSPDYDETQKDGVVYSRQRSDKRLSIHIEVTLSGPHNFFRGFTEDISKGGLFIATHRILPIGTEVTVTLLLEGREFTLPAQVVWAREQNPLLPQGIEPGMGLQFVRLSPEQISAIEEFIKKKEPIFFDADI